MRITKALTALVLLLALVAGTASAYISEKPRQGLAPISAKFHPEPTTREPGPLLGFELRFLGFCIRSGIISIDPFGLAAGPLEIDDFDKFCKEEDAEKCWNDYETALRDFQKKLIDYLAKPHKFPPSENYGKEASKLARTEATANLHKCLKPTGFPPDPALEEEIARRVLNPKPK